MTHSGKLIEGKIVPTAAGYEVEKKDGTVLVPASQIKFTAQSRTEIYEQLKEDMPQGTAIIHLLLARWCIAHKLYDPAKEELHNTLKKEPNNLEARRWLLMLKGISSGQSPFTKFAPKHNKPKTKITDASFVQNVQTIAGLSRDNASLFTRKVQPILVNKCSNGGCHGRSAKSMFQLIPVRSGEGSHHLIAEKNLKAVLKQIDIDHPQRSPLLTKTEGGHGKKGMAIFRGRTGKKQQQLLLQWVKSIAKEQRLSGKGTTKVVPASAKTVVSSTLAFSSSVKKLSKKEEQTNFLNQIIEDTKKDSFNPNEFNQQSKP